MVTLGEGRVGKTSIITRFVNNNFRDTTEETIEGYCLEKSVQLKHTKIKLSIWVFIQKELRIQLVKRSIILWLRFTIEMQMQHYLFLMLL